MLQLCKYIIIDYLDVSSFHTGRTGFDDTGALKLTERIYDHGPGNSHTVCNLAGYQDSPCSIQLIKNVDDRFQFGI